jgi:ATP-binding cassette subfamily B protein
MKSRYSLNSLNSLVRDVFQRQIYGYRSSSFQTYDFPEATAISFVLNFLGISDVRILSEGPLDFKSLLTFNDIVYRPVSVPVDILTQEYPPLLVLFEAKPSVVFRRGRKTFIFDGCTSQTLALQRESSLNLVNKEAFEIYPSLPESVSSASDLLPIAFGGQNIAVLALILTSAVVALLSLSIPLFTNYLVTSIIPSGSYDQLIESLLVVLLIMTSVIASQFLQSRMVLRLETTSDLRLQTSLWDRVMKLPLSILDSFPPADIVSRVDGVSKIRSLLSNGITSSIIQVLFSFAYFVLMFVFDQTLAIVALVVSLLYLTSVFTFTLSSFSPQRVAYQAEANASEFTYQSVVGYAQIKTSTRFFNVVEKWLLSIVQSTSAQLRSNYFMDQVSLLNGSILVIGNISIFAIPIYKALTAPDYTSITNITAQFVSFYSAYAAFFGGLLSTSSMVAAIAPQVFVLWERANPLIHASLEPGRGPQTQKHTVKGAISIDSLAYRFPGSPEPLFSDLTLNIPSGSNVAITGPTGCGKTTLIRLLLGLVQPSSGSIFIDGISLSDISITQYRRQIGCVMQDIKLPPGSIADIIRGSSDASDDEIWHALDQASFADDVRSMPMNINTIITSGGGSMSGGQRQRICIARALIRRPKLLFLDEATSALDNKTQQRVTAVFDQLGITRVVVAHRLSTLMNADMIYVLKHGKVLESGSWQALSSNSSSYLASTPPSN